MGSDVELHKYDWYELLTSLGNIGITNTPLLERVLLAFGDRCYDCYYLLNNEFWDEYNSYHEIASLIDNLFDIDENSSSFDVFLEIGERLEMCKSRYDVADELELEINWKDDEE